MQNLWPRIEGLLRDAGRDISRPARYLNHEWGLHVQRRRRLSLLHDTPIPTSLGSRTRPCILCNVVNAVDGMYAERGYLPAADMIDLYAPRGVPAFSLESCAPLHEFDAVGFSLSHELVATNVLEMLDLGRIPLACRHRDESNPLIVAGGPCAFNAEPFSAFSTCFCWAKAKNRFPNCSFFIGK